MFKKAEQRIKATWNRNRARNYEQLDCYIKGIRILEKAFGCCEGVSGCTEGASGWVHLLALERRTERWKIV